MRKPLGIISGSFLWKEGLQYMIAVEIAKELGIKWINIAKPVIKKLTIDPQKYDEFLKNYVYDVEHMDMSNEDLINYRLDEVFAEWDWDRER